MNKSETITELCAALTQALDLIEKADKDKENPHFRSKYADLGNVIDAIKPALVAHGLSFTQLIHDADNAAKVETLILHKSGEFLSCGTASVPVSKNDAQGYGSALTYARRYSLSAAFGVAPEDDDGNAAAKAKPAARSAAKKEEPQTSSGKSAAASLIAELKSRCMGERELMADLLRKASYYEQDGKEYMMKLDKLEGNDPYSEKWCGKVLGKVRETLGQEGA